MVKTIKLNDGKFQVSDSQVFFGRNADGLWEIYDADRNTMVAKYLDDYGWAECAAFQYVLKVG